LQNPNGSISIFREVAARAISSQTFLVLGPAMTPARLSAIKEVFAKAVTREPLAREAFVAGVMLEDMR
jgi:hypothetical protein